MASRSDLLPRLAIIPSIELLELMGDDVIFELASKFFPSNDIPLIGNIDFSTSIDSSSLPTPPEQTSSRPKRPLNAFMAFRSYYTKIFPDVQQKAISGFLTTLWHKEPCRNRWALIAKVYSFIRDEVTQGKVSLADFLAVCGPIMKVIEPSAYLSSTGWMISHDADGSPRLAHHPSGPTMDFSDLDSQAFPTTESDLLGELLNVGYLPEDSSSLTRRMKANNNGIMTPSPVPCTVHKLEFIDRIRQDPVRATRELYGQLFDEDVLRDHGYRIHSTRDLCAIDHITMTPPNRVWPVQDYADMDMNNNRPVLNWDTVPEHEPFSVNNPFALDQLLSYPQVEGEQSTVLPPSPPFRPEEDYHFMF